MTLSERVAEQIRTSKRLRAVPLPVIEAVLAAGFERLSEIVPMATPASEITAIEFEWCEACGHAIDPADPEGAVRDVEGVYLCNACAVEEQRWCEKPTPGGPCQLPADHGGGCVPVGTSS